jgi:hypothetical protein
LNGKGHRAVPKAWAIKDWALHYEKRHNDSEVVFRWIAFPTKHDGKGFRRIARHPEGERAMLAFYLMAETAAKMPTRGVLADEDGPLDSDDLSDATGFCSDLFQIGFKVLSMPKIAWIYEVEYDPLSSDKSRQVAPSSRLTEQNNTEQNRTEHHPDDEVATNGESAARRLLSEFGRAESSGPKDVSNVVALIEGGGVENARRWLGIAVKNSARRIAAYAVTVMDAEHAREQMQDGEAEATGKRVAAALAKERGE